jgi:hypothetical protein
MAAAFTGPVFNFFNFILGATRAEKMPKELSNRDIAAAVTSSGSFHEVSLSISSRSIEVREAGFVERSKRGAPAKFTGAAGPIAGSIIKRKSEGGAP